MWPCSWARCSSRLAWMRSGASGARAVGRVGVPRAMAGNWPLLQGTGSVIAADCPSTLRSCTQLQARRDQSMLGFIAAALLFWYEDQSACAAMYLLSSRA